MKIKRDEVDGRTMLTVSGVREIPCVELRKLQVQFSNCNPQDIVIHAGGTKLEVRNGNGVEWRAKNPGAYLSEIPETGTLHFRKPLTLADARHCAHLI